jgi:hypothetical protein
VFHTILTLCQIEGVLTIAAGFVFISLFPKNPANPVTIFGYRYFSERESQILQRRVTLDDPTKAEPRRAVSWAELKQTASPTAPLLPQDHI